MNCKFYLAGASLPAMIVALTAASHAADYAPAPVSTMTGADFTSALTLAMATSTMTVSLRLPSTCSSAAAISLAAARPAGTFSATAGYSASRPTFLPRMERQEPQGRTIHRRGGFPRHPARPRRLGRRQRAVLCHGAAVRSSMPRSRRASAARTRISRAIPTARMYLPWASPLAPASNGA